MTRRRKILLGLLAVAAGLIVVYFIWSVDGMEILCYNYVLPVVVVNVWEWLEPPVFMDKFFRKE